MFFLWFFGVGIVDGFQSAFRPAPRSVLRSVSFLALSLVSLLDPFCPFRPSPRLSLRPFVSFVRLGVSWGGSFGTGRCLWARRLACRLAWRDDGAFGVCAVFVSSFSRVVSSFLAAAVLVVTVTLFVFVPSGVSCGGVFGVGSLERVGMAVRGCGMRAVRYVRCGGGTA